MKKILSILFSIFTLTVMAQVPQGVGYQGVATDANGIELVNQSISIRASVLSGSANGIIEWEETHSTSTDTFGLFNLTIGQGTTTGNGVQADFADISWGTNTHFLKIEMDATGGNDFSFMGTNQMMSVPYALYAENANINYDSIYNLLLNDSTFISNVGSGMGGGGCDFLYPNGINGDYFTHDLEFDYIVPSNKILHITHIFLSNLSSVLKIDNVKCQQGFLNTNFSYNSRGNNFSISLIADEGQVISSELGTAGSESFIGFLVEKVNIDPITHNLGGNSTSNPTFTVPLNTKLIINNYYNTNPYGKLLIDNIPIHFGLANKKPNNDNYDLQAQFTIPVNGGSVVSIDHSNIASFNGYLVDEDYFSDCGGGSSSSGSNSTIDSLTQLVTSLDSTLNVFTNIFGCTDSTYCNFDASAIHDDGSCSGIVGCTDANAVNFNEFAVCNDNSCFLPLEIGQSYQGGVVAYIDETGMSGIIIASQNLGYGPWYYYNGCSGTSNLIGCVENTGMSCTIGNNSGSWGNQISAPQQCLDYENEIYDDWFLPNNNELELIYLNNNILNLSGQHWSSNFYSYCNSYTFDFSTGILDNSTFIGENNAIILPARYF